MKTLEDFDRELGRGGEETLEVPAWKHRIQDQRTLDRRVESREGKI